MNLHHAFTLVTVSIAAACNVSAPAGSGGVDLPARGDCSRGVVVVTSDYNSTELQVLSPRGELVSDSFLSSASTEASGLAAPLSGDVTVPRTRSARGRLVVVDRLGTNVISYVEPQTAEVVAQLPVGTGFESNPQDYLEVRADAAYVTRLGENRRAGEQPFDGGSDVLVVDPERVEIARAITLPRREGYLPNPTSVSRVGDFAIVTLQHANLDYSDMADSELIGIDVQTDEVAFRVSLDGLVNCGGAELSPDGERLAVACASFVDPDGRSEKPETSGIVLLDARVSPPGELERFEAQAIFGAPIQSGVSWASDDLLLVKTQTPLGSDADNELYAFRPSEREATHLLTAARTGALGFGIAFGQPLCEPGCSDECWVPDATRGTIRRFEIEDDRAVDAGVIELGGAGLPPIGLAPLY